MRNASELLDSKVLEKSNERINEISTNIYCLRPYASYERVCNEQMHTLIYRFIPKGRGISKYSKQRINEIFVYIYATNKKEIGLAVQQIFKKNA